MVDVSADVQFVEIIALAVKKAALGGLKALVVDDGIAAMGQHGAGHHLDAAADWVLQVQGLGAGRLQGLAGKVTLAVGRRLVVAHRL